MDDTRQVEVRGLLPTPAGCGVLLTDGEKVISIFVDHSVGAALALLLRGVKSPRPLTHDLIGHILAGLGVRILKVVVNDLRDDTFYARLYLEQRTGEDRNLLEIDARPSDSIALALQQHAPIRIARQVWDRAEDMSWALEQLTDQEDEPPSGDGEA